jgi:hypothetical protein
MRALTQAEVLSLWESGRSLHPLDQGVLALQAALPEIEESVADWPIGRCNRALAELHCAAFGPTLRGWTACRQCGEQLEFQMDGRTLAESPAYKREERIVVGQRSYRLPTSRDLAAVAAEEDATVAARRLVQQCCVEGGLPELAWNEEEIDAIGELMAAADPLAEIMLRFDCPSCGASFDENLDIMWFLWAEMEARAKRLLLSVHKLASAYGWSEAEILSLSQARREVYLEMVRA